MKNLSGLRFATVFAAGALAFGLACAEASAAQPGEAQRNVTADQRTAGRSPDGLSLMPNWVFQRPEHYDFLPMTSNHDPHHQHPQQWDGQDWEPAAWDGKRWTAETALQGFYKNHTFHKQYLGGAKRLNNPNVQAQIPVLEVGPTFYKLSDLDQRRALKLLADYTDVFGKGYTLIDLRDWKTGSSVGHFTPKGMFLY
ncbi:MAG: hypothetical protein RBS08_04410 [Bdellovibrionales bacterium]|jgi:hypothetical protein|nr:hypothetical protein [Bdellovibrionales bacterium]